MPTAVDKLVEAFPFFMILSILGTPTYESIAEVIMMLSLNSASVTTHLGGGTLVLLSLVVTPAVYTTLSAVPFVLSLDPGATPAILHGTTEVERNCVRYNFDAVTAGYQLYLSVECALRQQLLSAVDDIYVHTLYTQHIRYGTITNRQILDHLISNYANITAAELQDNDAWFHAPCNPNQPFKTITEQVNATMEYSEAINVLYSPQKIIANTDHLIFDKGMFTDGCHRWNEKVAANKTWDTFKTHFA